MAINKQSENRKMLLISRVEDIGGGLMTIFRWSVLLLLLLMVLRKVCSVVFRFVSLICCSIWILDRIDFERD